MHEHCSRPTVPHEFLDDVDQAHKKLGPPVASGVSHNRKVDEAGDRLLKLHTYGRFDQNLRDSQDAAREIVSALAPSDKVGDLHDDMCRLM